MAFYGVLREQDSEIEVKITFENRKEAQQLYYEVSEAKSGWSPEAKNLLTALLMASE